MTILLYGLDVCSLFKRSIQSLDFTVNRVLMKLFKTSNINIIIINDCGDVCHSASMPLQPNYSLVFIVQTRTDSC